MRMTLYYLAHTVKNQIRKLFRTWVAVFILVCFLFGALVGVGVGVIGSLFEEKYTEEEGVPEGFLPEEELAESPLSREERDGLIELAVGAISLLLLVFAVLNADKSGGAIFLPADVSLLFSAPIRPQTVLLFRLLMQMGGMLFATLYIFIQLPVMAAEALGAAATVLLLLAWVYLLVFSRMVSVLLYTVTATHPQYKRYLRIGLFAGLLLLAASFFGYAGEGADYLSAALAFFNAPPTRYIPVWGWLKAMVMLSLSGQTLPAFAVLAGLLAFMVLGFFAIWRIKADFYEDAMARSEQTAAAQAQAQSAGKEIAKRKKDRSERLRREGFSHGLGASVYFYKVLYNRFRFAYLHVFTKTSLTYLALGGGLALLMRFFLESRFFPAVAMLLACTVFFRSLGNPIAEDVDKESFPLVPDSAHRKVLFSFLGGTVNTALDLLPAFLLSAVLLGASPLDALLWFLLILAVGAYSDGAGMFIDLSLSTGLSKTLRALVQILFVYFGLLPCAVLLAVGYLLSLPALFCGIVILFCVAVAALSLAISPLFVANGRR